MQSYISNRTGNPQRARPARAVDRLGVALLAVLAGTVAIVAVIIEIGVTLPAWALAIVFAPATAAIVTLLVASVKPRTESHTARDREESIVDESAYTAEVRASLRPARERARQGRAMAGSGDRR